MDAVNFQVSIVNDAATLAGVLPDLLEHQKKAAEIQSDMQAAFLSPAGTSEATKIFLNSMAEATKIVLTLKDKILDLHHPQLHLSDKFVVVISRDSLSNLPQAFALLVLKAEPFRGKATIELYSIITAFRNLPFPENEGVPYRVKGAGSSIVEFCKEEGMRLGAKYIHLVAAPTAMVFYEKHGFQRENPESISAPVTYDPFGMTRTSMFFDLEQERVLENS